MKAEITNEKTGKERIFKPIKIELTIENEGDLNQLWASTKANHSEVIRKCDDDLDKGGLFTLFPLFSKLDGILKEYKKQK